jgi:hypothetical protein
VSRCGARILWPSLGLAIFFLLGAGVAAAQSSPDPLAPFLRGLADSTDAYFGPNAAVFDTTGIDSLIRVKGSAKPDSVVPHKRGVQRSASAGYHRATGTVLGIGAGRSFPGGTWLDIKGSYGFANKEGRYSFGLSRTLARRPGRPTERSGNARGALALNLAYARETVPFAAEHETPFSSTVGAFFTGLDRQSVYERRGGSAALTWSQETFFASAGWRGARDQSMPRATRFSLWGSKHSVSEVTRARTGSYREGFARIASTRSGLPFVGAEGQYASRSRWRARVAAAQSVVLSRIEAHLQVEGGMAARKGPSQDRFELGGPLAVPSLGFGREAGNRLLLGKIEFVHGMDLIRTLHIPYVTFMALHPAVFAQGASAWTADDGNWERPPDASWRGAAGFALVHIPGFPTPTTHVRLQMAWPVGRESGVARFSVAIGQWFDSIPKR